MKNNNKKPLPKVTKNEVFAWILAGLMIFWTIASVFGIIGFSKSCAKEASVVTASAETADSVNRGQYYIRVPAEFVFNVVGQGIDSATQQNEYFAILSFDDGSYQFLFRVAFGTYDDGYVPTDTPFSYMAVDNVGDLEVTQDFYLPINDDFARNNPQIDLSLLDITDFSVVAQYYFDGNSNPNHPLITVDYVVHSDVSYDVAYGEGFEAGLAQGRQEVEGGSFDDGFSAGQNVGYNRGFSDGRKEGVTVGKQEGYAIGYERGQEDGLLVGKDIGFADGVASAGDYSFMSLMSSVIDAPVQAFKGLFNFDLLGMNMAGFALGMLSLCAVLAVVRVVL